MKKTLFLSVATSLSLAMSFEEYQHLLRTSIPVRRDDESADNSLFWVDNKYGHGRTKYADDEADDSFYWVDNKYGGHRYADDEAFWVDNKYGRGRTRYADDEGDDSFFWVDNKNGHGQTRTADNHHTNAKNTHTGGRTRHADDEGDDSFYWVDNKYGGHRYADDEAFWVDNKYGGGRTRYADDEAQDNNLIIDKIKDGYYAATNWALANPDKVYRITNVIANGLSNPKWDDEELVARRPIQEKTKKPSKLRPTEVQADNTLFALGDLIAEGADN